MKLSYIKKMEELGLSSDTVSKTVKEKIAMITNAQAKLKEFEDAGDKEDAEIVKTDIQALNEDLVAAVIKNKQQKDNMVKMAQARKNKSNATVTPPAQTPAPQQHASADGTGTPAPAPQQHASADGTGTPAPAPQQHEEGGATGEEEKKGNIIGFVIGALILGGLAFFGINMMKKK